MTTEFKRAEADVAEAQALLQSSIDKTSIKRSDMVRLQSLLGTIQQSSDLFEKKSKETIEIEDDGVPGQKKQVSKYYGPKMLEKVLVFEAKAGEVMEQIRHFLDKHTIDMEEDIQQETASNETVQSLSFNAVIQGPTIVRTSKEEDLRMQKLNEVANAKRAAEAFRALETKQVEDDPLTQEIRLLSRLAFTQGIDGFTKSLEEVDPVRMKSLASILQVITKNPENIQYRTLSLSNASVIALLEGTGVRQCLGSLGFRPQLVKSSKGDESEQVAYVLSEPSVETDFDRWSTWFDTLKAAYERCK